MPGARATAPPGGLRARSSRSARAAQAPARPPRLFWLPGLGSVLKRPWPSTLNLLPMHALPGRLARYRGRPGGAGAHGVIYRPAGAARAASVVQDRAAGARARQQRRSRTQPRGSCCCEARHLRVSSAGRQRRTRQACGRRRTSSGGCQSVERVPPRAGSVPGGSLAAESAAGTRPRAPSQPPPAALHAARSGSAARLQQTARGAVSRCGGCRLLRKGLGSSRLPRGAS